MPTIRVKENEPFETALRRFKQALAQPNVAEEALLIFGPHTVDGPI